MKICDQCNSQIPFKSKFKTFWLGYQDIQCSQCSMKFKHTKRNRLMGALLAGLSPSVAYISLSFFNEGGYSMVIPTLILSVFLGVLLSTFLI